MQKKKKIYVQKNPPKSKTMSGSRSYLKLFLGAALGLVVLVVLAPFAIRYKADDGGVRKPAAEKGVVVREIPRPEPSIADRTSLGPGMGGGSASDRDVKVGSIPEFKSFPSSPEAGGSTTPAETPAATDAKVKATEPDANGQQNASTPADTAGSQPVSGSRVKTAAIPTGRSDAVSEKVQGPVQEKPKVPGSTSAGVPRQRDDSASVLPVEPAKPASHPTVSAAAKPAAPVDARKKSPTATGGKTSYVVQVGSFKDKQHAEEMKQNLAKRGYEVVIKPLANSKLGQLYVVQTAPVAEESKASTLMTQIGHEERVKPVIVKVPADQ
jgi:cell division septation protein DedD